MCYGENNRMTASKHNIVVEAGATFNLSIVWKDSLGEPIDLTDCSARMQIRQKVSSDTYYVSLTSEAGDITLGDELGTIDVKISSDDTETILTGGVYDLEVVMSNDDVVRLLYGNVELRKNVTR